jgi:hypothetical protein
MEDRHGVAETLGESRRGLRGERDLRHEHDRGTAALERSGDRAKVDLRLAAAGDPMQQPRPRVPIAVECGLELRQDARLLRGGLGARRGSPHRG